MQQAGKIVRKALVIATGFPLLLLGLILIPLPGPGLLVSLLALMILSIEFDWVKPHLDKAKALLKAIVDAAKAKNGAG